MKVLTSTIPATAAPSQTAALLCACFHTAHAAGDFIFFDIETTGPVSYTHLDVYKRQV